MTKTEIMNRIEEIKTKRFYLQMIDTWTPATYERDRELKNELYKLEQEIA